MKWWNLKKNKCPKCDHTMEPVMGVERANCPRCNFSISFKRMQEIIESQNHRIADDIDKEMDPESDPDYYAMEL